MEFPFSAACERNKEPILEVIRPLFVNVKSVLEIGAGTGQHAVYFAEQLPHVNWQPSDQEQYLAGIESQIRNAKIQSNSSHPLTNLNLPIEIDVSCNPWLPLDHSLQQYDAVYTANTLHIMPWQTVTAFLNNVGRVLADNALLIVYGPFKYNGQFTSASNQEFDQDLQSRGSGSAIRDFEQINCLAKATGFNFVADKSMPANNQCLVWRYERPTVDF